MTDITKYNAQKIKTEQEIPTTALMDMANGMIQQVLQMVSAIEPKDMQHQQMIMQAQNAVRFVMAQIEPAITYAGQGPQQQNPQQGVPPNFGGQIPRY
jgi:hypothetical protein